MNTKKIIILLSILILAVMLGIWFSKSGENHKKKVKTEKVFRSSITRKVVATGKIVPNEEIEIKSKISGIVEEIYVNTGDRIVRGQALVKIRLVPDAESVNNAESGLRIAEINLESAKKELENQRKMYENGVSAAMDLRRYEKDVELRKEEVLVARNRLELLKEGAARQFDEKANIITSTVDGTVLGISAREGGSVMGRNTFNEGTTLLSIANLNAMVFEGKIGESDIGALKMGMDMEIHVGALEDQILHAKLGFIAPKGEDKEGTVKFQVSARIQPDSNIVVRAGYSANADIITDKKDSVLSVHEKNLSFSHDSAFVEVLNTKGDLEKRFIRTGISDGMVIEVLSGLSISDQVKEVEEEKDEENP